MALSIKAAEPDRLARALFSLTGLSMTAVVAEARARDQAGVGRSLGPGRSSVLVIDSSAIVAIVFGRSLRPGDTKRLQAAPEAAISAVGYVNTATVLAHRLDQSPASVARRSAGRCGLGGQHAADGVDHGGDT